MYDFAYHKPSSLAEAAKLLADPDAKAVSGGHTLIPALKHRLNKPSALVDLSGIAEMKGIRREGNAIIIGGGAAGLMCAATAGYRGKSVTVLEGSKRCGKKILMSGGGRCNFTNTGTTPAQYLSANPHFCKSALARYTPWHFIELVERHRIAYHEKELGQLFCDESSKLIVKMLLLLFSSYLFLK